jgi:hypothetical protein
LGLLEDRYVGKYEGHTIELVRSAWYKTLSLWIDGKEVSNDSCMFPGRIILNGTLVHDGAPHAVVAKSIPRYILWTTDTVEVDGQAVALTKTK